MNILNLGCGTNPLKDAVNVDIQPFPGVDVVANAYLLPFLPGRFKQVFCHNPYGFNPLCKEVALVLEDRGTLMVAGQPRNPFFKKFLQEISEEQLLSLGFQLVETGPVTPLCKLAEPKSTSGRILNNNVMIQATFRKIR